MPPDAASECRATGYHKYDDPGALRAVCLRCGIVRRAVRVSGFWRGFALVRSQLRWVYEYPKQDDEHTQP